MSFTSAYHSVSVQPNQTPKQQQMCSYLAAQQVTMGQMERVWKHVEESS